MEIQKRKILFIAPLPPPITGISNASKKILDGLGNEYEFMTIDFSKRTLNQRPGSLFRIVSICKIIGKIIKNRNRCDLVYLTLSQSILGNLKDIIILFVTGRKYQIVHLHGGGIRELVYDKYKILYYINKFLLRRVNKIIVLSESLKHIYKKIADNEKVVSISNYAENEVFLTEKMIMSKYENQEINVLFLSNFIDDKGYKELLESIRKFNNGKFSVKADFAGDFVQEESKDNFLKEIEKDSNIRYHGVVVGQKKKKLLEKANVFCLPTYYKYEGQPISILEAYASGCIVITTNQGGISDIFKDSVNGVLVNKRSASDIIRAFNKIISLPIEERKRIGLYNMKICKELYSEEKYLGRIREIFQF